jgi:hypothetical protein
MSAHPADHDRVTAWRYSIHRWAPTQPTPNLDYVLWLRETITPEDLFDLADALNSLAHAGEDRHQSGIPIAYVVEDIMSRLARIARGGAT